MKSDHIKWMIPLTGDKNKRLSLYIQSCKTCLTIKYPISIFIQSSFKDKVVILKLQFHLESE
jgi:hypothetical protein